MADLALSDELVAKIRDLAQQQQRTPDEVVTDMLQQYHPESPLPDVDNRLDKTPAKDPLIGLIGLLDDEIQETDLSSTVRETLKQYTHPQYGWTKRDRTD
jgi:hypothetical protein